MFTQSRCAAHFCLVYPQPNRTNAGGIPLQKTFLKPILKNVDTHNWYSYRAFQHQLWRSRGFLMKQLQGFDRYLLYKSNKRHLRAARAQTCSDSRAGCKNWQQNFPMISKPKMIIRDFRTEITVQQSHALV